MLSEQELTTILQMLRTLCQHIGVNVDFSNQEIQSFSKTTDVPKLASKLRTNFRRSTHARYVSMYGQLAGGKGCTTLKEWLRTLPEPLMSGVA